MRALVTGRIASVLVVVLAALGLVVFDPNGPRAVAIGEGYVNPRLTVPTSVLNIDAMQALDAAGGRAAGTTASGVATNVTTAAKTANVWKMPVSWGNLTKVTAAGGTTASPLAVGAAGFFVGFEGTNTVMRLAGVDNVGFTALWDAYGPKPDPEFVPNIDLGDYRSPGWTFTPSGYGTWIGCGPVGNQGCQGAPTVHNQWAITAVNTQYQYGQAIPYGARLNVILTPSSPNNLKSGETPLWSRYQTRANAEATAQSNWSICQISEANQVTGNCSSLIGNIGPNGNGLAAPGTTEFDADARWYGTSTFTGFALMNGQQLVSSWYPVGSPNRPPDQNLNPDRVWETRWSCTGGAGLFKRSPAFKETDTEWPAFPEASCPDGAPLTVSVWQISPDGSTPEYQVGSWSPSEAQQRFATEYPECGTGTCVLELQRIDAVTGARVSCFDNPTLCVNWVSDPARADNYRCQYAGRDVEISECFAYGPTFNIAAGQAVQTESGTVPANQANPYGNPANGDGVPKPEGGTSPAPGTEPRDESCPPPFSWSGLFNNWWAFKAAECAIKSTFVPRPAVMTQQIAVVRADLAAHAPTSLLVTVPEMAGGITSGLRDGCTALPNFSPVEGKQLRIACDPPDSSAWRVAYGLMTGLVWVGVAFGLWNFAHRAFGAKG
jgi:hypothetical protein